MIFINIKVYTIHTYAYHADILLLIIKKGNTNLLVDYITTYKEKKVNFIFFIYVNF